MSYASNLFESAKGNSKSPKKSNPFRTLERILKIISEDNFPNAYQDIIQLPFNPSNVKDYLVVALNIISPYFREELERDHLIDFYVLLKEMEDAYLTSEPLRKVSNISAIKNIKLMFLDPSTLSMALPDFQQRLSNANTLYILNLLANLYEQHNIQIHLENGLLHEVSGTLINLQINIESSDLSAEVRAFLLTNINTILTALLNYRIYGTEGLIKATESTIGSTLIKLPNISENNQNHPIFRKTMSHILGLYSLFGVAATGLGFAADTNQFLVPTIEDYINKTEKIEIIFESSHSLQEAFEKAAIEVNKSQKLLTGADNSKLLEGEDQEPKLLPPAEEKKQRRARTTKRKSV